MKRILAVCLMVTPAWAAPVTVPSGQPVEFVELVKDVPGVAGVTWRFRFVAPQISREGGTVPLDAVAGDMDALCEGFVLPHLADIEQVPDQVIISLADRAVGFGVADPDSTQFFEAYRVENTHCIWEGF